MAPVFWNISSPYLIAEILWLNKSKNAIKNSDAIKTPQSTVLQFDSSDLQQFHRYDIIHTLFIKSEKEFRKKW